MEIWACVSTCGTECSFSFSAGGEFDYDCIKDIEPEHVKELINEGLGEAFWEAMFGDNPVEEILEMLREDSCYKSVLSMTAEEQTQFVRCYVEKIIKSSEITYKVDETDITDLIGVEDGEWWQEFIFEEITGSILGELRRERTAE